jgi:hypothetical protein
VTVDPETGTVVAPGGADLAPDTLYERGRTGAWPDQDVADQHRQTARLTAAGYPFTTQTPVNSR